MRAAPSKRLELATSEGFMQALPGKVTILADAALSRDEIDVARRAPTSKPRQKSRKPPAATSTPSAARW